MSKKHTILLLKFAFITGALYLVFRNADMVKITDTIAGANIWLVVLAALCLNIGQIGSSFRMRYYLSQQEVYLSDTFSIVLYYIGMFYNNILPGGIGGDGYKVFLLKKEMGLPAMQGVKILLADRVNGLLLLMLILIGGLFFSEATRYIPPLALAILFPTTILGYLIAVKLLFNEHPKQSMVASVYSLITQGGTTIAAWILLLALGMEVAVLEYVILFLIASVLGVLPISIGGLGVRELTFFYGAQLLPIDAEAGVAFALCFWAMYVVSSLIGIPCLVRFKKALEKERTLSSVGF